MQVPDNVVAAIKTAVGTGKILTAVSPPKTMPPPLPEQPKREPKVVQKKLSEKRDWQPRGEISETIDSGIAIPASMRDTGVKVEANVPLPPRKMPTKGKSRYPFQKMKVNDSFFVKFKAEDDDTIRKTIGAISSAASAWRRANNKKDQKFTVRRVEGGARCWRIA